MKTTKRGVPVVKLKKKHQHVDLPEYKTTGAAGCDVTSDVDDFWFRKRSTEIVPTGLFIEIPKGFECQVRPRSGLAANQGITVLNSPGTIDSDYRGEVQVILYNSSDVDHKIKRGDRIAQLVFAPVVQAVFEEVDELSSTKRGTGGLGSTGI